MYIPWRKLLSFVLALLLAFAAAGVLPAAAAGDTVRIGYFRSEKYGYIGADGNLRGYDVQLSKVIGMYGGFRAEMVGYDNVADMEEALRTDEVDVLIDFLRTEQREETFIFTNASIMEEQVNLYTRNAPDAPSADSLSAFGTLRVGYVSGSGFLDYFTDYCSGEGLSLRLTAYHDESVMYDAMERGETDACVTGSAIPTGYRVLISLPPLASYMMLRPEDEALRSRIDAAISQIKTDDPDYISNLYQKYVASHDTELSPLTPQEQSYLAAHPELTVAVVRGAEPYTVERDDGSLGGVIPDYYRAMGEKLGVTFRPVAYDETQDAIAAVAGGEADILGHYYGDVILAEKDGLYDTMEYASADCARLTRSNDNGPIHTVAATNRTAYLLAEQLESGVHIATYPNIEACYQALMDGEVDAVVGYMTGVSWLINQHTMRGVRLSILPDVSLGIRGAVSRDNPTLLFVLNKAIAVSSGDMDRAVIENAVNGKTDLRTALENLPAGVTAAVVSVLALLVILLIVSLALLVRSSRERVALLNRELYSDGLTGAGSRRYGTELLFRELLLFRRYGDGPLLAMLDVDHFKRKNDEYGHEYGDFVLKKVVQILRETLRQSDSIIRWGGDEFILVCPRIRGDGADRILEKVVRAVSGGEFLLDGRGEQVTVSVGAAFFAEGEEDIVPALRRCDSALYEAKRVRNSYHVFS